MVNLQRVRLGDLLKESKIVSENPSSDKRIKVKLNVQGVEKRSTKDDENGATKYFIRKAGQFIYGKQNLHKGAFGIIPMELDHFESSSDIPAFDVSPECNPEWIYYFFKQGEFYKQLEKYSKGTGSKRIHFDKIAHLEIPLPERREQDKIINEFKIKEQIYLELNFIYKQNELYISKLRKQILHDAFRGKLVSQNFKEEPASELLKKIKLEKEKLIKDGKIKNEKPLPPIFQEEIPYKLPKGWEWSRLLNISEIIMGQSPDGTSYNTHGEGVPLINGPVEFSNGNLGKTLLTKYTTLPTKMCKKGDLLICVRGSTTGKTNIASFDSCIGRGVAAIRSKIFEKYLQWFIIYSKEFIFNLGDGTTFPNISQDDLTHLKIPVPPINEQERIIEKVDQLMKLCYELEKHFKENQINSEKLIEVVLMKNFEK